MDKIILKQMSFYAYHGAFPEENKLGQRFMVDLELRLNLQPAGQTDQLKYSIDYGQVFQVVQKIVEGQQFRLIEALAESIANTLLTKFSVPEVLVRVTKPDPPIPGHYESVGVEVVRSK
ncbi:dihydroneopterin aldolase [Shimazuella sp. AN120528]|uniref:dihydroneopterin aldolase n=1 Tax=Shimazuella soli TaxID=1892854 RepID=UPI001F0EC298|nr:dihydroneopterin aldolase [Shimazuella soli]MCH5585880.1 dihydroneopterin aldolase [Shimazuella soli]